MTTTMKMKAFRCLTSIAWYVSLSLIHRALVVGSEDGTNNNNTDSSSLSFTPCANSFSGNQAIPITGCKNFYSCWKGALESEGACGDPLLFDNVRQYCNYPSEVCCPVASDVVLCPGYDNYGYNMISSPIDSTLETTETQPTVSTNRPTIRPSSISLPATVPPTLSKAIIIQVPGSSPQSKSPSLNTSPNTPEPSEAETIKVEPGSISPSLSPTFLLSVLLSDSPSIGGSAILHVESKRDLIEKYVLRSYYHGDAEFAYPSTMYKYEPFIQSLQTMAVDGFGADFKFNLWEGGAKYYYGLVNLAAFLANCMVESIEADTCAELNWQQEDGRYAMSNACGQESRSYQDETCDATEDIFSCEVVKSVQITATSNSSETSVPPPFQCKPGSGVGYYSGYWEAPNGPFVPNTKYANDLGRTDVEGCCFWGRGALLTRGVCNIGKLNYYLGKRGADLGNNTLYPTVDFCRFPEAPCARSNSEELRWIVAFFEWAERVQRYSSPNWQFDEKLIEFVDNGMVDDDYSFIDSVSRILTRGCHEYDCSEFEVRMLGKRRSNFYLLINVIFDMKALVNQTNTTPTAQANSSVPRPSPESQIIGTISTPVTPGELPSLQSSTPTNVQSPNSSPKNGLIGLEGNGVWTIRQNQKAITAMTGFSAVYFLLQWL